MLNITTLRSPRTLAIAAAFALAAALPGAGLVQSAHAAPAIPPTTLTTTVSGPTSAAAGGQATYTVAVSNDPFGAAAINFAVEFGIKKTDGKVLSFNAPGATCAVLPSIVYDAVRCTRPSLAVGGEIDLSVNVMFNGNLGVDTLVGVGLASNAPTSSALKQTTIVAQEQFPSQNPGYQPSYGGQGYGGSNA